jgi:formylglycine-generating enzyme required for sulfatase activity
MSKLAASEFCAWLSVKSGRHYRLPTEQEWTHACLAGSKGPYGFGDDASKLADYAWFADNAEDSPHPVARKKPNAWGLYDMHGNVAEWCETPDGKGGWGVVKGGSYKSPAPDQTAAARELPDRAWNASDPQVPKSKWWLANGPFIGFRIVCDNITSAAPPTSNAKPGSDPAPKKSDK